MSSHTIAFLHADQRIKGRERKSKLIDPASPLYAFLATKRAALEARYGSLVAPKRMDFHIEVLRGAERDREDLFLARVATLQGVAVRTDDDAFAPMVGRAWVIPTPAVEGYGPTHITVAFFRAGLPADITAPDA